MRFAQARHGFSLIELLVVIGIIALLMGIILSAIQRVRAAADRLTCQNHLRQIGIALHTYHSARRQLPPGVSFRNGADPYPFMGWQARLLPYIEQDNLWQVSVRAFQTDKFFRNNPPHIGVSTVIPLYSCPSDSRTMNPRHIGTTINGLEVVVAFTAYLGVSGADRGRNDGVFYLDSDTRFEDVRDGLSNTVLVGERPPSTDGDYGWWYGGWGQVKDGSCDCVLSVRELNVAPRYQGVCPGGPYQFSRGRIDNSCDAFHFWSTHTGGGHFLFGDGSVRFLTYAADSVLPALASRSGGEVVSTVSLD